MISLLTSFKPFSGNAAALQLNALDNWRRLGTDVEIIVYGQGAGVQEQSRRFGALHVPDIRGNTRGIPDFAAIAEHAARHARFDRQVYLNGDILLPPDFVDRLEPVVFDRYLVVGQRIDLARDASFDFTAQHWNAELQRCQEVNSITLHNPAAQDYFIFPRGLWQDLPSLIIGRGGYDNALLAYCLRRRIPVVDATWALHVVHQWHDYSHVKGRSETFAGEDAIANARLHDIEHSKPDIEDAGWRLTKNGLRQVEGSPNPLRRCEVALRYVKGWKYTSYALRALTRLAWMTGAFRPRDLLLSRILGA